MVSSHVQTYLVACLKGKKKNPTQHQNSGRERVKVALRVALFLSGDISCTDTVRGTPAALKHRPPNQKPAVAGKNSPSPSEALRTTAASSRP